VSWPRRLALLLPSVWLVVAFGLPTGTESGHSRALYWLALALTLAGSPYLAWALLRITLSGYDALTHRHGGRYSALSPRWSCSDSPLANSTHTS
jgi:hypothetical protein